MTDAGCNPFMPTRPKRRSLWRHFIVWGAILLASTPLVILGWRAGRYFFWRSAAQRSVDAEIARVKDAGEPLTAVELHVRYRVPPAQST